MTYLTQSVIASNYSMRQRVAQCVAAEAVEITISADEWTARYSREWAASPGWDAAWESALAGHPDEPDFDPGADEAVITDGMILSAIQPMVTPPPEPEPKEPEPVVEEPSAP